MKKEIVKANQELASEKLIGLWRFTQNNSGGIFHVDENVTICVYVEAESPEQASSYAQSRAGIYFNGCDAGRDCSCCGDRWSDYHGSEPYFANIEELEKHYNEPSYYEPSKTRFDESGNWVEDGEPVIIVYLRNGDKIIYRK